MGWASRAGAWILEDDYDGEFRYSGKPLEALQGLDAEGRVVYLGSFSKVLFPSLRLGYLVVPPVWWIPSRVRGCWPIVIRRPWSRRSSPSSSPKGTSAGT